MKRDVFWNSLGTAAWSFLSLFLLVIVTRINGIAESGLFSFAFAFAIIMFTIVCFGGRTYQVSDHKNDFTPDNYISVRLITSLAVTFITLIFVTVNGYDLHKSLLIFLLVGHRVFDGLADVFYAIAQKKHHLYISGKSLFFKSVASLIVFLVIDILTENILVSALALPFISLLFIIFYDIPQSRRLESFTIALKLEGINSILKSNFLPFTITAMALVYVNIARYFVDLYYPSLQGYFGIIIMPLSLVILLFSFISTPSILHLTVKYHDKDFKALHRSVLKIISIVTFATVGLCILMFYFGAPILKLLFGVNFEKYVLDIVLVIIIGLAVSVTSLFTNIAIIARGLKPTAGIYFVSVVLLSLLCIILVKRYRIHGAIIAYLVASGIQTIIMGAYYTKITTNYKFSKNL